jgi:cysteamine dioxygenase
MLSDVLACAQRIALLSSSSDASAVPCDSFVSAHTSVGGASAALESTPSLVAASIQSNLATIRASVQSMRFSDLCLPCTMESILSNSSKSSAVQFHEVLDHPSVSICLIAFPPGSCIPLHDHPGMHVFTRVICGQLNITMLDIESPMPRAPVPSGTAVNVQNLRTSSFKMGECCELSPVTGNIHGVACVGNRTALMLDVNIPPYKDDNCHFFSVTKSGAELCVIDEAVAWSKGNCDLISEFSAGLASDSLSSRSTTKKGRRRK